MREDTPKIRRKGGKSDLKKNEGKDWLDLEEKLFFSLGGTQWENAWHVDLPSRIHEEGFLCVWKEIKIQKKEKEIQMFISWLLNFLSPMYI